MRRVTIEGTTLRVSRWSFGTGSLHHLFSSRDRLRLLHRAADTGFSHFDTSPLYGDGLAELDLGKFLRSGRQNATLATKVGLYPAGGSVGNAAELWLHRAWRRLAEHGRGTLAHTDWSVAIAERSLDTSLMRMHTDYVDVLYLHEPDPDLLETDEFLRWLEREFTRGRIRAWGLAGAQVVSLNWIDEGNSLAQVLQVKDSLEQREADALTDSGRTLQFTYGYLSGRKQQQALTNMATTLDEILRRNPSGSIIISTRRVDRLAGFAQAAEDESCV